MRFQSKNGIDMGVVFNNLLEADTEYIVFKVIANNHRIDLDEIKYAEIAKLRTSDGLIIDEGFIWELNGGGHHISGSLKLPKIYNGKNIINEGTDYIHLEFEGVGNAEKMIFKWGKEIIDYYYEGEIKNEKQT